MLNLDVVGTKETIENLAPDRFVCATLLADNIKAQRSDLIKIRSRAAIQMKAAVDEINAPTKK